MSAVPMAFAYETKPVRVIIADGEPWWVATDLAAVLGYSHTPNMIRMLDDDQKGVHSVNTPGGAQDMTVVTEGGMYRCIFGSKRPEAKEFRRWVENVLLPTLRRTGRYVMDAIAPEPAEPAPLETPDEFEILAKKLALVKEVRISFGVKAARKAFSLVGLLPELTADMPEERFADLASGPIAQINRTVVDWLNARCRYAPGHRVRTTVLYDDYLSWARSSEVDRNEWVTISVFGRALGLMGIAAKRTNGMHRVGLSLIENA